MKECRQCKNSFPEEEKFFRRTCGYMRSACRACELKQQNVCLKNNPEKAKEWKERAYYKYEYGITLEEANILKAKGCNNCGSFERLHIDHCHSTDKVRGCLCGGCNTALGLLKDDPKIIQGLLDYINNSCIRE